jgi:hypothetical protein
VVIVFRGANIELVFNFPNTLTIKSHYFFNIVVTPTLKPLIECPIPSMKIINHLIAALVILFINLLLHKKERFRLTWPS